MEASQTIKEWYDKKTKLKSVDEIKELNEYIKKTDQNILDTVQFSSDYEFTYYDLDLIDCDKIKVRPENIFKINFLAIVHKLKRYFSDVEIEIGFEVPSENDKEIKHNKCTYKHDTYIKVSKTLESKIKKDDTCKNTKYYEIGLEYFESVHDRIKDDDKYISSKVNLDGYYVYYEKKNNKKNKNNNEEYKKYIKETIYSIFVCICALSNDKYTLSKVIYFKNYKDTKNLKYDTDIFNNIINWETSNIVDLKTFFDDLNAINPDIGGIFKYNEFIEYIKDNYDIEITKNKCNYDTIIHIINNINSEVSLQILSYRNIYSKTMRVLVESQGELFKWLEKKNEAKDLIPDYLRNILRCHIQNYRNKDTLRKVLENLQDKKL